MADIVGGDAFAAWPSALAGTARNAWLLLRDSALGAETRETLSILRQLECDSETITAALCYASWMLDDKHPPAPWPKDWSPELIGLIEGQQAAQRVQVLHARRSDGRGVEGLRRLLLAMIGDLRVVFIVLARQLARMRSARKLAEPERHALAQLSADIHAPLANRLGIWQVKWELEDLAFSILQPVMYQRISRLLDERRADREAFIKLSLHELQTALKQAGIEADLAGRPKHIYSIWRKMQRKRLEFSELYDIRAIRVLVNDVTACYATLGVVHSLWMHISGEFDDYIARPKGNDYKSLHTAVIGPSGKTLEVQIRTHEMHQISELGVAAHWRYKEGAGNDNRFDSKVAWMRNLLETHDDAENDDAGLLAGFRADLLEDRVYLLTPRGDVFDLPAGATVLDFAYHVHTDVGHRCRGAKVNGRIVPLPYQPRTGDTIEVLTGKERDPSRDWLSAHHGYLNTSRARDKVRAWFRRGDHAANLAAGQILLDRELKRMGLANAEPDKLLARFHCQTHDELLLALAIGDIGSGQIARALQQPAALEDAPARTHVPVQQARDPGALSIGGVGNLTTMLARCCQPLPGDAVQGFITRGRGVSVHRANCKSLANLRARDADRVIDVEWGQAPTRAWHVDIEVRGYDRKGMQKDVTALISNQGAHIVASSSRIFERTAEVSMRFTLRVGDYEQLSALLSRLSALPNVLDVRRMSNA